MGSLTKKDKAANTGLERARAIQPNVAPASLATLEITINEAASGKAYVGYSLSACSIRITNPNQPDLQVTLKNKSTAGGGQLKFRTGYAAAAQDTLTLTLPGNGGAVAFFIGGKFNFPSVDDQDNSLVAIETATTAGLAERTFMVRVRKNANNLTPAERDRFLTAYASLNSLPANYQRYLDGHNSNANSEIHGRPSFLPWHRAFVLDLERRLQAIDESVAIPYWRFDQTSPNVFSADFMGGTPNAAGRVTLSPTNPLRNWSILGTTGIVRTPLFNTNTSGGSVMSQDDTLNLGSNFTAFSGMEGNPHGRAHTSFSPTDVIRDIARATHDPIFFMLHSNVDRLWAKWQLANNLWAAGNSTAYSPQSGGRIGDNPGDTMWPWNGITGPPRPPVATGGQMPQLSFASKPSPLISLKETIDYIGRTQGNSMHFDYDDVPFI